MICTAVYSQARREAVFADESEQDMLEKFMKDQVAAWAAQAAAQAA